MTDCEDYAPSWIDEHAALGYDPQEWDELEERRGGDCE